MCCPEALQYFSNTSFVSLAPSRLAFKNNRLSSAKSRWFTAGAAGATIIPLSVDDWSLLFRRHARPLLPTKTSRGIWDLPVLTLERDETLPAVTHSKSPSGDRRN
jgi:hypothetical protein